MIDTQGLIRINDPMKVSFHKIIYYIKVFPIGKRAKRRQDVYDIDDVLVLELTQKFDFTEDALRIHNIFECPGNFFNGNFSARFYIKSTNHNTISAAAHWAN